jgi:hypothetical protein
MLAGAGGEVVYRSANEAAGAGRELWCGGAARYAVR